MKYTPHKYQQLAEEHIYNTPRCGLFLEMGLGRQNSCDADSNKQSDL